MSAPSTIIAIGDVQGCAAELQALLARIELDAPHAQYWFCGDLVNRGPGSLEALRMVRGLGGRAVTVLGNHDLHLLGVACGVRKTRSGDTLDAILTAPDRDALLDWLRSRPLAHADAGWLLVHAGLLPQWSVPKALALAAEVHQELVAPDWATGITRMFGKSAIRWDESLRGADRLRAVVNALTRMRFCSASGMLDLDCTDGPGNAPPGFMPWFDVPGRKSAGTPIAFGHWSALGLMQRDDLLALDTGCVWGGALTAVAITDPPRNRRVWQVGALQNFTPLENRSA
jgi:bis(5'-nucleosyl)-tetraphosphatase (symmetrical)